MGHHGDCVGRVERRDDVLHPERSNAFAAALGREAAGTVGDPVPLLHHWLYFWNVRPRESLGLDGHPKRGGFLPEIPLSRRMWAGGRVSFLEPLLFGERVSRTSTVIGIEEKSGRTGNLVFVTVRHEIASEGRLKLVEEQDLVFRDAGRTGSSPAPVATPAPGADWVERLDPDPILLFRYSALTMNSHRIHYDHPYATADEGYAGLIVHGPLQATLLTDLAVRRLSRPIARFEYRGVSPAIAGHTLYICGNPADGGAALWTEQGGVRTMNARAIMNAEPDAAAGTF